MKKKTIKEQLLSLTMIALTVVMLVASCSKSEPVTATQTQKRTVQCDTIYRLPLIPYKNITSDLYSYEVLDIYGDCMAMELKFGGGCGYQNYLTKYQNSNYGTHADGTPIAYIKLSLDDNDPCRGFITWEDNMDIIWIKQDLQSTYDSCYIFLEGASAGIPDTTLTYTFQL